MGCSEVAMEGWHLNVRIGGWAVGLEAAHVTNGERPQDLAPPPAPPLEEDRSAASGGTSSSTSAGITDGAQDTVSVDTQSPPLLSPVKVLRLPNDQKTSTLGWESDSSGRN